MTRQGKLPTNLAFANLFTMGSPIALWGLRYGLSNFSNPIRPQLWLNFLYPQDLVALPLKSLNEAYARAVTEDVLLSPGGTGFFTVLSRRFEALLPVVGIASHSWYFTDNRVIGRIAAILAAHRG